MSDQQFSCRTCGATFTLPESTLARYPGWTPKQCLRCRDGAAPSKGRKPPPAPRRSTAPQPTHGGELNLSVEEVLRRFDKGPKEGVFTDGACSGNPGPGGWGAVHVRGDQVVSQEHGHEPATTNNRMELTALIAGYRMLDAQAETTIYSDSQLCVRTINEWAAQWERQGWRRKTGPVKNLELVKQAYQLAKSRPKVKLCWIKAHDGSRWNEYADSLATAYLRDRL